MSLQGFCPAAVLSTAKNLGKWCLESAVEEGTYRTVQQQVLEGQHWALETIAKVEGPFPLRVGC